MLVIANMNMGLRISVGIYVLFVVALLYLCFIQPFGF